ncbi:hypothetical protein [Campylobacter sp. 19-13652]|uniref:hypothetical protein n=1 Tax=Campylobacter sp. 19-13652 TaxID=2840180 RepID=UPI001C789AED|nr:hypothetical protein [Campylobacter sp. 19-13652]BCX79007.1 hypothetical protein LBC_04690 [Campylobacter sp. 19-13652]
MSDIKFSGKTSEYTAAISASLDGAIIINDSVFERDYSRVITDPNINLIFTDGAFKADEFLVSGKNTLELDGVLPFKKKFSIMESNSQYKLIEFGKHVNVGFGSRDCVSLSIFGYDERMDSIIIDTSAILDYVGYSYAIADSCFSLKLTGVIDKEMLSRLIFSCACAVYCAINRQIKVSISVDSSLIFSQEYNCEIIRGV